MNNTPLSRRDFLKGLVLAAGASILVSCVPAGSSQSTGALPTQDAAQQPSPGRALNFLIAYDSVYGNTKQIAESLIEAVDSEHETKLLHAGEASFADLENVDLVIIGSPTHGGTFTDQIKTFIANLPAKSLEGVKAAAFDTGFERDVQTNFMKKVIDVFGYASPKIAKKLENKGAEVIGAKTFLVLDTEGPLKEGEIDRAKTWLLDLLKTV